MPHVATLSASIMSADLAHAADQVKLVEPYADVFHIDIMDARFVPPLTIGPVAVAALRPDTDRTLHGHLQGEAPEAFFDELADVMVCVHPGYAGQSFIPESLSKVTAVRTELERRGLRADVEIDGGVKLDNAERCVEAGATVIVAATAIFQAPDIAAAARDLVLVAGRGN